MKWLVPKSCRNNIRAIRFLFLCPNFDGSKNILVFELMMFVDDLFKNWSKGTFTTYL